MSITQPVWNFEQEPWTDEQLMEWDANFTTDGNLLLACSEREVFCDEYRRVIAHCMEYRNRVRAKLQ